MFRLLCELAVSVPFPNLANGSVMCGGPFAILSEAGGTRYLQLLGPVLHHNPGNVGRIGKKRAKEAHGAKLNRISQPVVSAAMRSDLGTILVIHEEILANCAGARSPL